MIDSGLDLEELAGKNGLSVPLALGIGAGLGFEYRRNAHQSPSRIFIGLNRDFASRLRVRARAFLAGQSRAIVHKAVHENALYFSLDSSPIVGLMGMEMLAEDLPQWAELADWQSCARFAQNIITNNDALHRRSYLNFLREVEEFIPSATTLMEELDEIASEWETLGGSFGAISMNSVPQFSAAGSKLRRLASREEHFWGRLLEASEEFLAPPTTPLRVP